MRIPQVRKFWIPLLALLVFTAAMARQLEVATPSAAIMQMTGDVQVAPPGAAYRKGTADDDLRSGWKIKTGANSAADLLLWDESVIRLQDKTEVVIVDLSESEKDANFVRKLELKAGRMWVDASKKPNSTFEVKGPQAVAAVKGTSFAVETLEEEGDLSTDIQVWEGLVECSSGEVVENVGADSEFLASKNAKPRVERFNRLTRGKDDPWLVRNWQSRQKMQAYLKSLPKTPRGTIDPRQLDPQAKAWLRKHFNEFPPSFQRKLKRQLRPGAPRPGGPGRPGLRTRSPR